MKISICNFFFFCKSKQPVAFQFSCFIVENYCRLSENHLACLFFYDSFPAKLLLLEPLKINFWIKLHFYLVFCTNCQVIRKIKKKWTLIQNFQSLVIYWLSDYLSIYLSSFQPAIFLDFIEEEVEVFLKLNIYFKSVCVCVCNLDSC